MDVTNPADDEFEVRLAWSPPPLAGEAAVRPAAPSPARPAAIRTAEPAGRQHDELLDVHRIVLRVEEELVAVRRAVLDSPHLEELARELGELRRALNSTVAQVQQELAALRTAVADHVGPSAGELDALKEEMVQLRRRIGLRANGVNPDVEDAMVERVADATVARLTAHQGDSVLPRSRRLRSR